MELIYPSLRRVTKNQQEPGIMVRSVVPRQLADKLREMATRESRTQRNDCTVAGKGCRERVTLRRFLGSFIPNTASAAYRAISLCADNTDQKASAEISRNYRGPMRAAFSSRHRVRRALPGLRAFTVATQRFVYAGNAIK